MDTLEPEPNDTANADMKQTGARAENEPATHPAWQGYDALDFNLVLEGGAMRILFTAGVLDFLMLHHVFAKRVIGVSAGALVGLTYACGLIGKSAFVNEKYCQDKRYLSMRNLLLTGNAVGRDFMFRQVPAELEHIDYSALASSPTQLISVASNLDLGEADYHVYHDIEHEVPYLIASSSLPLASTIVQVDGKRLLDGGTCDSVPIVYSMLTGEKKHVVITTHDATYVRKPDRSMPLMAKRYAAYPHYVERARMRYYEYNRTYRALARMHEAGQAFVIMPPEPVTVATMETDPAKLRALYEQGYKTAMQAWPSLQKYLEL